MSKENNHDFESDASIREVQDEKLRTHISYLLEHSPYYQRLFDTHGIKADQILGVQDLPKLPLTTKAQLEKHNKEFVCIDQRQIVEYVTTSGTLGTPIDMVLGKDDLSRLAYNESRSLGLCGVTDADTVLITTTLDKRFMAGMAYYLGATTLGAAVIRSGIGDMAFQLDNIKRYHPTVLIAVPSFAYKLGLYLQQQGLDPAISSIQKIICIGEAIREADLQPNILNEKITKIWQKPLFSTYASTEMATAFTECESGLGGHLIPELMILEIVDEQGQPVAPGMLGEVVATPLQTEGMPLLRYQTGDLARLHTTPCPCGRHTPRLGPVEGRKGQLIKLKGTSIYPQQIENALHQIEGLEQYFIALTTGDLGTDQLSIHISNQSACSTEQVTDWLSENLRVRPQVIAADPEDIFKTFASQKSRKPSKFVDLRIQKLKH